MWARDNRILGGDNSYCALQWPLAKLQHKSQSKLMVAQDDRLKAISEALVNMKVLKLYAWESHFKNVIENLRKVECKWLSAVQMHKAYDGFLFRASPVLVSTATFGAPELENTNIRQKRNMGMKSHSIFIKSASFLWEESPLKPMLRNICGEVSSGKSTVLAAILGEVPNIQIHSILFGLGLDNERYQETLEKCSLVKDLDLRPYGDRSQQNQM
ncbi:unnamed protein product [Camellia sinensis]